MLIVIVVCIVIFTDIRGASFAFLVRCALKGILQFFLTLQERFDGILFI